MRSFREGIGYGSSDRCRNAIVNCAAITGDRRLPARNYRCAFGSPRLLETEVCANSNDRLERNSGGVETFASERAVYAEIQKPDDNARLISGRSVPTKCFDKSFARCASGVHGVISRNRLRITQRQLRSLKRSVVHFHSYHRHRSIHGDARCWHHDRVRVRRAKSRRDHEYRKRPWSHPVRPLPSA